MRQKVIEEVKKDEKPIDFEEEVAKVLEADPWNHSDLIK